MPRPIIKPVTDQSTWENFILSRPETNFLHSWNWGLFHQNLGKAVTRLGLFEQDQLQGAILLVLEKAVRATYLTIAGGPIIDWHNSTHVKATIQTIKQTAQNQKASFIRIRPQIINSPQTRKVLKNHRFLLSPIHLTADLTIRLNLDQDLDQILSQMRKSTRYDIRRADKLGITVTPSQNPEDIKQFHKHQLNLAKKHHFVPFSYPFLFEQFKVFAANNQAALFHAYQNNQLLATVFIIFYNNEAVYHYGISTPQNQKLPGTHAALWAAIKEAKNRKLKYFNLWGIAPENQPHHRFAGVSRFKRGFGGEEVAYLPAHDLPISRNYHSTRLFELIRKKIRRL